jgi:hypothetical protein
MGRPRRWHSRIVALYRVKTRCRVSDLRFGGVVWVPKHMPTGRMRRGGRRVSTRAWRLVAGLHAGGGAMILAQHHSDRGMLPPLRLLRSVRDFARKEWPFGQFG